MYNNQYHMDAYPTQQGNISETNFIREHQRQQHHNSTQEYLTKQNKHAIQKTPPSYPSPEASFVHQVNVPVALGQVTTVVSKPSNHFVFALLTCLFCCWPISICALINSCEVNAAYAAGNMQRAQNASAAARRYSCCSFWMGLCSGIIGVIIFVILWFTVIAVSVASI